MEKWHRARMKKLGVTDLYDPYGSVLLCADILDELSGYKYGDDITFVLTAYNRGAGGAAKLHKQGIVSDYANKVLTKEQDIRVNNLTN